jgi:hypothetical protein
MKINGQDLPVMKPVPIALLKQHILITKGVNFALWLCGVLHSGKDGTEYCSRELIIRETGYSKGRISRARTFWTTRGGLVDTNKRCGLKGKIPVWRWLLQGDTAPIPFGLRSRIREFSDSELRVLCLLMTNGLFITDANAWVSHYDSERFLIPHLARQCAVDKATVYRALNFLKDKGIVVRDKVGGLLLGHQALLRNPNGDRPIIAVSLPPTWKAE